MLLITVVMHTIAAPLPLAPGDPLTLSQENEQILFNSGYAKQNIDEFEARQFPWFSVGSVLLLMGFLPLLLNHLEKRAKEKRYLDATPLSLQQKALLLRQPLTSQGKIALIESLLKDWWSSRYSVPASSFTLQEMASHLPSDMPPELLPLLTLLIRLEPARFDPKAPPPTESELKEAQELIQKVLQRNNH